VAGSGKTTTLVELLRMIPKHKRVIFIAFNRDIVKELKSRVPSNVEVKTIHSFGLNECRYKYGRGKSNDEFIVDDKVQKHILRHAAVDFPSFGEPGDRFESKEEMNSYLNTVEKLIDMFRLCLPQSPGEVQELIQKFDIQCYNGELDYAKKVFLDVRKDKSCVDFTDMIYFPAVGDWRLKQYDFVLTDESQDFNRCQQAIIKKMVKPDGGRLIAVGDPYQAIYGFAGADHDSFNSLKTLFPNTIELPLSVCYRCDASIIEHARQVMPNIEARDNPGPGSVRTGSFEDVQAGDFVLCRNTRPLVSLCLKYISQGKKANIKGKDIGTNLANMVKGTGKKQVTAVLGKLEADLAKLRVKTKVLFPLRPVDEVPVVANLIDKIGAIRTIAAAYGCKSADEIVSAIGQIFSEDKGGIVLSTMHKSKGLEADNVYILDAHLVPSPWAKQEWELDQERNLDYVARTRAKKSLVYIADYCGDPERFRELRLRLASMFPNEIKTEE
jgi:DNA helicase-2/ATP-dependent DNA helicase PcrA